MARPRLVALEVTTRCNLKCAMCPHGVDAIAVPKDADAELVDALWPAVESAETVHLNGVGEPLLAGTFWRIVDRLAGRAGPRIDFNTNGLLLSEQNVERLASAPLGLIGVSLDAATARTYGRIRGGRLEQVKDGVRLLVRRLGSSAEVMITFVVMRENLEEMEAFVDLGTELGVGIVRFGPLTDPPLPVEGWSVTRPDGWVFRYGEQRIDASDSRLIERLDRARLRGREIGVRVEGIGIEAAC